MNKYIEKLIWRNVAALIFGAGVGLIVHAIHTGSCMTDKEIADYIQDKEIVQPAPSE